MKFLLVLASLLLALSRFVSIHGEIPPGKEFYESLPRDEKHDFLAFALGDGYTKNSTKLNRVAPDFRFPDELGIDAALLEKFKNLDIPENFATKLFVWIKVSYNLNQADMRTLILRRSVCLSNGNCIDINDVGALCCPF